MDPLTGKPVTADVDGVGEEFEKLPWSQASCYGVNGGVVLIPPNEGAIGSANQRVDKTRTR